MMPSESIFYISGPGPCQTLKHVISLANKREAIFESLPYVSDSAGDRISAKG